MAKEVKGSFVKLNGETFYKIENYDFMEDFFMTITSSCDVWNFCWSQGGITAGRKDCDHAVFPYYTADKLSDVKNVTGPYTALAVKKNGSVVFWEPFSSLSATGKDRFIKDENISLNIYKNENGTKVFFEEINGNLNLTFRYGWTSSSRYGLVRNSCIENNSNEAVSFSVLDGCRNIMSACTTADFQNSNSVLLDAYKKTDLNRNGNLALFAVSSVVTDKAEPLEGLYANTCWFSTEDKLILSNEAPKEFYMNAGDVSKIGAPDSLKGKRPSCYIAKEITLGAGKACSWYQVFDTSLTITDIADLEKELSDKASLTQRLEADIEKCNEEMTVLIGQADGIQDTQDATTVMHHRANVMFNIMRGGIFADNGRINAADLIKFTKEKNLSKVEAMTEALSSLDASVNHDVKTVADAIEASGDVQLRRMFTEYLPLNFSRRHGDPSRPWNRFNIKLTDSEKNPILNYEGNWRDIFQNWEALGYSYPEYVPHFTAKFLNTMTADGFNPYHISRDSLDWEVPDPTNPWAQYGYWGDHQVIYLQKLLELYSKIDRSTLLSNLDSKIYTTSNVPYRIKSYKEVCENPRKSIAFDAELSKNILALSKKKGSDQKLIQTKDGEVYLTSLTAKVLQIVLAKATNLVPAGGIWMNTQRPEWNDANNALAGYGLSVVTLCYYYRMLSFLETMYSDAAADSYELPACMAEAFEATKALYAKYASQDSLSRLMEDDKLRKAFTDECGIIFEKERNALYTNEYTSSSRKVTKSDLVDFIKSIKIVAKESIMRNKREDGLFHSYNILHMEKDGMRVAYLQEMLEGQVAILSANLLSDKETLDLLKALRSSRMYEERQNSYMLYPPKELNQFYDKNCIAPENVEKLSAYIAKTGNAVVRKDSNGTLHFNPDFSNEKNMEAVLSTMDENLQPTAEELELIKEAYEKTFKHSSFTGRSNSFYAYEGIGSIYWHMVSKLLLAVQENTFKAVASGSPLAGELCSKYYEIRSGLSFNKKPEIYGAFPIDPYSHTPYHQGAKQPGMTGQVKEEVLTRWGELGVDIVDGEAQFKPSILMEKEFNAEGKLSFSWCAAKVVYHLSDSKRIAFTTAGGTTESAGSSLTREQTSALFARNGSVKLIEVWISRADLIA